MVVSTRLGVKPFHVASLLYLLNDLSALLQVFLDDVDSSTSRFVLRVRSFTFSSLS